MKTKFSSVAEYKRYSAHTRARGAEDQALAYKLKCKEIRADTKMTEVEKQRAIRILFLKFTDPPA